MDFIVDEQCQSTPEISNPLNKKDQNFVPQNGEGVPLMRSDAFTVAWLRNSQGLRAAQVCEE